MPPVPATPVAPPPAPLVGNRRQRRQKSRKFTEADMRRFRAEIIKQQLFTPKDAKGK